VSGKLARAASRKPCGARALNSKQFSFSFLFSRRAGRSRRSFFFADTADRVLLAFFLRG
jgi:hypothetical protein